jgi:hypothetical protein
MYATCPAHLILLDFTILTMALNNKYSSSNPEIFDSETLRFKN